MLNFIAFPNTLCILHRKNETNVYGSKVVLSGEPSKNKNKFKNKTQNHFFFQKVWFRIIFGSLKNFLG